MIPAILIALGLAGGQEAAPQEATRPRAPAPPLAVDYAAPPVRPFEPSANFAVRIAEGAEAARPYRRPLEGPAAIDAYRGDYEAAPSDAEAAYAQGVAQAEIGMSARMGPLDGRWRVLDADDRPLMTLVLTDPGAGAAIEGGWRAGEGPGRGIAAAAMRLSGTPVEIVLDGWCVLRLTVTAAGISGVLVHDDAETPVRLQRF